MRWSSIKDIFHASCLPSFQNLYICFEVQLSRPTTLRMPVLLYSSYFTTIPDGRAADLSIVVVLVQASRACSWINHEHAHEATMSMLMSRFTLMNLTRVTSMLMKPPWACLWWMPWARSFLMNFQTYFFGRGGGDILKIRQFYALAGATICIRCQLYIPLLDFWFSWVVTTFPVT